MNSTAVGRFIENYVRPTLLYYLIGLITACHIAFAEEMLFRMDVSIYVKEMTVLLVIPGVAIAIGFMLRNRIYFSRSFLPEFRSGVYPRLSFYQRYNWLIIAAVMFGMWSGGYTLVAYLVTGEKMHSLMLNIDERIPFRPEFVWFYLSVYPIFVAPLFILKRSRDFAKMVMYSYITVLAACYIIFLMFPVGYPRETITGPETFSTWALQMVFNGDKPWNCFPSSHCAMALMAALVLLEINTYLGLWGIFVALSIGVSTLYTKQHYIIDVIAGYTLTLLVYYSYFKNQILDILSEKRQEIYDRIESSFDRRVELAVRRVIEDVVRKVVREEMDRVRPEGRDGQG